MGSPITPAPLTPSVTGAPPLTPSAVSPQAPFTFNAPNTPAVTPPSPQTLDLFQPSPPTPVSNGLSLDLFIPSPLTEEFTVSGGARMAISAVLVALVAIVSLAC